MNVWQVLETLCVQKNPHLVAIIEVEDAQEIVAMRKALIDILSGVTQAKIVAAKKLLGMKTK